MRLLLDTQVFLWYITADARLPGGFRAAVPPRLFSGPPSGTSSTSGCGKKCSIVSGQVLRLRLHELDPPDGEFIALQGQLNPERLVQIWPNKIQ
jgi:hypothetical protein